MPMGNCMMQSLVMKGIMAAPDCCSARHVASSRSVRRVRNSLLGLGWSMVTMVVVNVVEDLAKTQWCIWLTASRFGILDGYNQEQPLDLACFYHLRSDVRWGKGGQARIRLSALRNGIGDWREREHERLSSPG